MRRRSVCALIVGLIGWYVSNFIVKPNQLVRERPFIEHNIEMTRRAYALDRIELHPFPADTGVEALDAANNQATLENIRLWDSRALQDTLRQIQEIRTYYDFPDIDIDRYHDRRLRAPDDAGRARTQRRQTAGEQPQLDQRKADLYARLWRDDESGKWLYAGGSADARAEQHADTEHHSGPDRSARPEIYFGELTNTDVYVKTRQKEFNYPQGDSNNLSSYEGNGGIRLGGLLRRTLIAFDRGDITKLPFSDDVSADSRLLMRRSLRDRVQELAPFLTFDPDPYVVVGEDGKIYWLMDAFTTSEQLPICAPLPAGRRADQLHPQ